MNECELFIQMGHYIYIFYISKLYEFVDTVSKLQGPPPFLPTRN